MKVLAKLKRLATASDEILNIIEPVSSDDLLDRHLNYPILSPRHFAQRYNKLYEPIELIFNGQTHKIQFNYCAKSYHGCKERMATLWRCELR
jgi:hypothetical protein